MATFNGAYGVGTTDRKPVYVQSRSASPTLFRGENLTQPTQDGFISVQKPKNFYEKNKAIIWALGAATAFGAILLGRKAYKLDKVIMERVQKITEGVKKLDTKKFTSDCNILRAEHGLKPNHPMALVDLKNTSRADFLNSFDEVVGGYCKDSNYAIVGKHKVDGRVKMEILKLYKADEVDSALKATLDNKKGRLVLKK